MAAQDRKEQLLLAQRTMQNLAGQAVVVRLQLRLHLLVVARSTVVVVAVAVVAITRPPQS